MKKNAIGKAGFSPGSEQNQSFARHGKPSLSYVLQGKKAVGCIVQARMGSTRLPGKTLMEISGKPVLWYVVERLKKCKKIGSIAVATSTNAKDNAIEEFCRENGIKCCRGSEQDVLARFFDCAKKHGFGIVVRVTADCPLIDPKTVDLVVESLLKGNCDYAGNTSLRTFPRGLDVEAFSFKALERVFFEAKGQPEREHVTPYIYLHREIFKVKDVESPKLLHRPDIRLCIDTKEDFELVESIFLHFKDPLVKVEKAIKWIDGNPSAAVLNRERELEYRKGVSVKQEFKEKQGRRQGNMAKREFCEEKSGNSGAKTFRVLFYGGRQAGAAALFAVKAFGCKILGVFAEDEIVASAADSLGLKKFGKQLLSDPGFVKGLGSDLLVCCHGRKIIKKDVLDAPAIGCINIHPMLFRFKGADPVGRWLEAGSRKASVGVHWMTEEVDGGKVVLEKFCLLEEPKSYLSRAEVYNALYPLYSESTFLALKTIAKQAKSTDFFSANLGNVLRKQGQ